MTKSKNLRVAIVHDILDSYGGAERVVEEMVKIWPQAHIFTSRYQPSEKISSFIKDHPVHTSFMQSLPFFSQLRKVYTPLYPYAFESFDLSEYDLVISSTAHFAKGVLTTPEQLHVCYCHTPPRFLYKYSTETDYRHRSILKPGLKLLDHGLRKYDFLIAQRPDVMIANSQTVAQRIEKFYRRKATVINPPVDVEQFKPDGEVKKDDYFLVASRLIAYKNIDLIIKTFNQNGKRLIIAGTGSEYERLSELAGPNVELTGFVEQERLVALMQRARALLFTTWDEDFGIVPVEAMAAGTPVIAYGSGGVTETVIDKETGIFYQDNSVNGLNQAINDFETIESRLNYEEISQSATRFSSKRFQDEMREIVNKNL